MRSPKRHVRLLLRLVGIGLVVAGALLATSWVDVLMQTTVDASASGVEGSLATSPEVLRSLAWAAPLLLVGLVLLVATTKREQRVLSLLHHGDEP